MRTPRTSAERRAAAIERVIAGTSTAEIEARKLNVSISTMRGFVTSARKQPDPAPSPSASETPAAPHVEEIDAEATPALDRALGAAFQEAPRPEPKAPEFEPVAPDLLVQMAETFKGMAIGTVAARMGVVVEPAQEQALYRFSPAERVQLVQLAPYAAPYVQKLMGEDPRFLAWAFVGVFGFSVWGSLQVLKSMRIVQTAREMHETPMQEATAAAT